MGNYQQTLVPKAIAKKLQCVGLITLLLGVLSFSFTLLTPSQTSALTTVPTKMNFQGRLTDSSGNIKPNGTYNMKLRVYDASSGGTLKFSEDRLVSAGTGVEVTNGLFSIRINEGSNKSGTFDASIFASGALYLEVELPTPATATSSSPSWDAVNETMTPRNQLLTSAYAYNAETLDGIDSANFAQVGQSNIFTAAQTININSTSAFDVQNGSAVSVFKVDTTATKVVIAGNLTFDTVAAPATAVTAAVNATAGNLSGNYLYRVVYVAGNGQTELGPVSNTVTPTSQRVNLTNIPVSGNSKVTARKIYRTTTGGYATSMFYLVTTINDNTTTTYTDNTADGSLGALATQYNTASGQIYGSGSPLVTINTQITALGLDALSGSSGGNNVAVGYRALQSNTIGVNNTAIGSKAGTSNTSGTDNVFIGNDSGYSTTGGWGNTYIGSGSGYNTTGSKNVFIGYQAGLNETGDDKLIIGNSASTPLIAGNFSAKTLTIDGTVSVSGSTLSIGTTSVAGSLSVSDGSSNTATISVGSLAGNYTYNLPVITANDTFCMQSLANCGGGSASLSAANTFTNTNTIAKTSTTALRVQTDSGAATIFSVDTTNSAITVNGSLDQTGAKLTLKGTLATGATYYPRDIDVVGNYAYVIGMDATNGPFTIVDVTSPTSPTVVSTINNASFSAARDVRVAGRYAYIVTYDDRLVVVDVSNPASPSIVGSVTDATYLDQAHGLEIQGKYAYVAATNGANANGYLTVVDISVPSAPAVVGSVNHADLRDAKQVDINGKYAYVSGGGTATTGGLVIVDISNPLSPTRVGSYMHANFRAARDVVFNGKYVYMVGANQDYFGVFDVSNPASPTLVGQLQDSTNMDEPYDITLNGRYAYISARLSNNIAVVDISNPASLSVSTSLGYTTPDLAPVTSILNGRYLYVGVNTWTTTVSQFRVLDTGGVSLMATSASSLETHTLQVEGAADIAGELVIGDALFVGLGGVMTNGGITLGGALQGGSSATFGTATTAGALVLSDGSSNTASISVGNLAGNYTYSIPVTTANDTLCLQTLGNCAGGGTLQTVYTASTGSATPEIKLDSTRGGLDIQDANTTIGGSLLTVRASNGSGLGTALFDVTSTGATTFKNSTDSSNAFAVQNTNSGMLMQANTVGPTTNKVLNPGFEANTTGWAAKGSAAISRNTTEKYFGTASLQFTTTALANDGAKYAIQLLPNTQYNINLNLKGDSTHGSLLLGYSADGTTEATYVSSNQAVNSSWNRYTYSFTTPGTINGAAYLFVKQNDAVARTSYVDSVQIIEGATNEFYSEASINFGGDRSVATSLGLNTTTPKALLHVNQALGQQGLLVQGNGDMALAAPQLFAVRDVYGNDRITYSESTNNTTIRGGSSFWDMAALDVKSVTSGAPAMRLFGFTGQTADIFQVRDGANATVFDIGADGSLLTKTSTNSASAFKVVNSTDVNLLNVDTSNNIVSIGTSDTTGTVLVLDTKTGAGDPTGSSAVNGAMYYNSSMSKFRCYQNGVWVNCIDGPISIRSFIDTTSDAVVDANTTNYWDVASENNNSTANITPVSTGMGILGTVSMEVTSSGTGDTEVVARIERGIGSVPTCGSGTVVGGSPGAFSSNTGGKMTSTVTFYDTPATTSQLYYVLCSDAATVGTTATVSRIRITLQEAYNTN